MVVVRVVSWAPRMALVEQWAGKAWTVARRRNCAGFRPLRDGLTPERAHELATSYHAERNEAQRRAEDRYKRRIDTLVVEGPDE